MDIFTADYIGSNGTGKNFEIPDGAAGFLRIVQHVISSGPFTGWDTLNVNETVVKLGLIRTLGAPLKPSEGGMIMYALRCSVNHSPCHSCLTSLHVFAGTTL